MRARFFALFLSGLSLTAPTAAAPEETSAPSHPTYVAKVDPGAFHPVPFEEKKLGAAVSPSAVRLITPGVDKFSIYRLIGPPHFGEAIARRWNYVLFFPVVPGSAERMRCRMEIRFDRPPGRYDVIVSEVIWQEQSCADRVAAAG